MPRKSPTINKNNRAKRRSEIAQGLHDCILRQGYLNTTVRDIALEANLNTGLIHHYFESKEEILFFLMENIIKKFKDNIAIFNKRQPNMDPLAQLRHIIEFMFKKLSRDKEAYIIFYELFNLSRQHKNLSDLLKGIYKDFRNEVENLVTACFVYQGIETDNVKTIAAFLVSACEGAGAQWMIDPRSVSIPKLTIMAKQFIEFYLEKPPTK